MTTYPYPSRTCRMGSILICALFLPWPRMHRCMTHQEPDHVPAFGSPTVSLWKRTLAPNRIVDRSPMGALVGGPTPECLMTSSSIAQMSETGKRLPPMPRSHKDSAFLPMAKAKGLLPRLVEDTRLVHEASGTGGADRPHEGQGHVKRHQLGK